MKWKEYVFWVFLGLLFFIWEGGWVYVNLSVSMLVYVIDLLGVFDCDLGFFWVDVVGRGI